jgi:hypothetical protein
VPPHFAPPVFLVVAFATDNLNVLQQFLSKTLVGEMMYMQLDD